MSRPGLDLYVEQFRGAAPQFASAADRVARIRASLEAALDAEHGCWGGDAGGNTFLSGYGGHKDHVLGNLTVLRELLSTTGDAVTAAAASFNQTEQDNLRNFIGPVVGR